jgi:hypothetical protein
MAASSLEAAVVAATQGVGEAQREANRWLAAFLDTAEYVAPCCHPLTLPPT